MDIYKITYTAGYIDGDGCFYMGNFLQLNRRKPVTVFEYSIQIISVKIESLEFIKALFGGAIIKKPRRINHKQPYCWTIKGKRALKMALKVKPYLIDKDIQCEHFIHFGQTIVPNKGKIVDDQIIQMRYRYMAANRENKHSHDLVTKEKVERLQDIDTIQPTEIDYSYLAGLIDAEGCFRIKKWKPKKKPNYVYAITLEIGNKRFPIFEFLMSRFGGSVTFIGKRPRKSQSATWCVSSFSLAQIIPKIIPYLIIKKPAAEKVIEFYNTTIPNGGDRHSDAFKKMYTQILIDREKIVDEIHKLNLKGLKN